MDDPEIKLERPLFYKSPFGLRFEGSDYWFKISSSEELIPSNPDILPEGFEEEIPKD